MRPIWTIARLTCRETARRRLLVAGLAITVLGIGLSGWGFSRIPTLGQRGVPLPEAEVRLVTSQLLILTMFMASFILALGAVFVAALSMAGDLESGVALSMLARPLGRVQLMIGKWMGLTMILVIYSAVAVTVELAVVRVATGYSPPDPVGLVIFLSLESVVLMTLSLVLSTRLSAITAAVLGVAAFGLGWLGGIIGSLGVLFDNATVRNVGAVSQLLIPSDGLWRGAVHALEPAVVIATAVRAGRGQASNPFFAATPPSLGFLAWTLFWLVGLLALASLSIRRREI